MDNYRVHLNQKERSHLKDNVQIRQDRLLGGEKGLLNNQDGDSCLEPPKLNNS